MSDARQQLNEMKRLRQAMEDINEGNERPYVCHHNKKGEHECKADSSYGAVKKAAEAWGLDSTAGISATLTDVKQSTQFVGEDAEPECPYCDDEEPLDGVACLNCGSKQFVGEDEGEECLCKGKGFLYGDHGTFDCPRCSDSDERKLQDKVADSELSEDSGHSIKDILADNEVADLLKDLDEQGDIVYGSSYFDILYDHFLTTHADEIPVGHRTGRPDDVDGYVLDNLERDYGEELQSMIDRQLDNRRNGVAEGGIGDDPEGKEFIDDFESKLADNNPCMYCDGEDDDCEVCHGKDEMFEGDPDDTDWDAHWAREDGDDERADDLEADAEFARMDDELDEVGAVKYDDYGATPVYENDGECNACYGLGRVPKGGADCPECKGIGKCPKIEEDHYDKDQEYFNVLLKYKDQEYWDQMNSEALPRDVALDWADDHKEGQSKAQRKGRDVYIKCYNNNKVFKYIWVQLADPEEYLDEDNEDSLGIGMKPADYKRVGQRYAVKRDTYPVEYMHEIDSPYKHNEITTTHDTRQEALAQIKAEVQAYISAFDDPSVTHERGSTVWQGKIPHDPRYSEGSFDQRWSLHEVPVKKWVEGINLESIVESVLEEFPGQPKDYYDEYDDPDDLGPIARGKSDIMKAHGAKDMPMSDYENDTIDPEIKDEELGLRFD